MFEAKKIELEDGVYIQELSIQSLIEIEQYELEHPEDKIASACRLIFYSTYHADGRRLFHTPEEITTLPWTAVSKLVQQIKALNGLDADTPKKN